MRTTTTYTPINVTLTEGEIGIILCSLEDYVKNLEEDSKEVREIDQIFEELENAVDDHYNEKDGILWRYNVMWGLLFIIIISIIGFMLIFYDPHR